MAHSTGLGNTVSGVTDTAGKAVGGATDGVGKTAQGTCLVDTFLRLKEALHCTLLTQIRCWQGRPGHHQGRW